MDNNGVDTEDTSERTGVLATGAAKGGEVLRGGKREQNSQQDQTMRYRVT